ncbi:hypothetical protein MBLNU457_1730t1 [Dothideomycetes sp. NU457]
MSAVHEAIQLVHRLNDPHFAQQAPTISARLQHIQLSQDGWAVADALLDSQEFSVQFYGALTFQIKLNRDAKSLSEQEAQGVLKRLITCYLSSLAGPPGSRLVFDKVCSTLATYFVQSPFPWSYAIQQVSVCLQYGTFVNGTSTDEQADHAQILDQFGPAQRHGLLRFARMLAEDLAALEGASPKHAALEESMKTNVPALAVHLRRSLVDDHSGQSENLKEAMSAYSEWTSYSFTHWSLDREVLSSLQQITPLVLSCLMSSDVQVVEHAAATIADILDQRRKFLTGEQRQAMWKSVQTIFSADVKLEDYPSCMRMVVNLAKTWIPTMLMSPESATLQEMLRFQTVMISRPHWETDGCEPILLATEFWNDYAEAINDKVFQNASDLNIRKLTDNLLSILPQYLKILPYPQEPLSELDDDIVEDWKRLRDDIQELASQIASIPQSGLFGILFPYTAQAFSTQEWSKVEAGLTLFDAVADDIILDEPSKEAIEGIFANLSRFEGQTTPLRLKRLAIRFVNCYMTTLKQKPMYIMSALHLLVGTIEASISTDARLADYAAKCFASLCFKCRHVLLTSAPDCVSVVEGFFTRTVANPAITVYQKEKIYASIAAIIEAMPHEQAKIGPLQMLITRLQDDLKQAFGLIDGGEAEQGEALGVGALQCLSAVGRALQHQEPEVVDVDDDDDGVPEQPTPSNDANVEALKRQVWTSPAGLSIQTQIISTLESVTKLTHLSSAWEAVCAVLRVGLSEQLPGPFVLQSSLISSFLSHMSLSLPLVEALLTTSCSFVSAYSRGYTTRVPEDVYTVYRSVGGIMASLADPSNDPQVSQLCIDFIERLCSRYADVLLGLPQADLQGVLMFTLRCMTSEAPMLKRTTCSFLVSFLELPKNSLSVYPQAKAIFEETIQGLNPHLALALISQISGQAQRSELDSLAKVLRSFVHTQVRAKMLLEQALAALEVQGSKAGEAEKRTFVQKVAMLRGGRQTNEVVKQFWAVCRGTVGSF